MQYGRCTVFVGAHSRLGRNFRLSLHRYLARRRASKHLPRRLDSGESALWVTPMEVAAKVAFSFKKIGRQVEWISARVTLGSGEKVTSRELPVADILDI